MKTNQLLLVTDEFPKDPSAQSRTRDPGSEGCLVVGVGLPQHFPLTTREEACSGIGLLLSQHVISQKIAGNPCSGVCFFDLQWRLKPLSQELR